ncbi:type II toxin-antitoxin system ParD family antitoxin [Chamaesiphon sp. GL140_3_metabinner_50]|uniref:ribbon-helix-helix domain-containing protein n=1 Tax=Chamaesiphon sp. GL140_3_metabinner_50 TaxID=2970812 RepID=UPI0025E55DB9|nr:type II toxin-antitoxin system ParD family antitoxin [Chamaesiphon sp. GL140_3_metabinner_50]
MTYLTIALPEAAKAYIDRQIASGHYGTADEFLTALIEREQERQAKQKVNAMLRSTLQKDRTVEATDKWWEQQRQDLKDRLPPQV